MYTLLWSFVHPCLKASRNSPHRSAPRWPNMSQRPFHSFVQATFKIVGFSFALQFFCSTFTQHTKMIPEVTGRFGRGHKLQKYAIFWIWWCFQSFKSVKLKIQYMGSQYIFNWSEGVAFFALQPFDMGAWLSRAGSWALYNGVWYALSNRIKGLHPIFGPTLSPNWPSSMSSIWGMRLAAAILARRLVVSIVGWLSTGTFCHNDPGVVGFPFLHPGKNRRCCFALDVMNQLRSDRSQVGLVSNQDMPKISKDQIKAIQNYQYPTELSWTYINDELNWIVWKWLDPKVCKFGPPAVWGLRRKGCWHGE